MVNKPEVLAIIPARGGSKGIPKKNLKKFSGYPLIVYSIVAGIRSSTVSRVIVSTDDQTTAEIANAWGAETPFIRPTELSENNTLDYPVLVHCLDWLSENEDYQPDLIVWLRPTSPIRTIDCVDDAVKLLLDYPEADSIRGVVPVGQNPFKMWILDDETDGMKPLIDLEGIKEPYNAPRQSLPDVYWQTGHIDAIRLSTIRNKLSVTGDVILPLFIEPRFTVDLDVPSDWEIAERTFLEYQGEVVDPAKLRRSFPEIIKLMVLDFDGVLTDNRVWVNELGQETIAANRSDSLGIEHLQKMMGIDVLVLSRESNPVVTARCKKLGLEVIQSALDKRDEIKRIMAEKKVGPDEIIFVGNDINDLDVFPEVGYVVAPNDAHSEVLRKADLILSNNGGHGAVRELCDMIISRLNME